MKDEALFNVGRLYAETGETDKSTAAFRRIKEEYAGSIYNKIAMSKIEK